MAPKDFKELEQMLEFAVNYKFPVFIRYPRGGEGNIKFEKHDKISLGASELLKEGADLTIIAIGKMVERAIEVANEFCKIGVDAEVINARFLKPFDNYNIIKSIEKTRNVITIEDGLLRSGLSTTVNELIVNNNITNVKVRNFGYDDKYVKQGSISEIEKINGLDVESIVDTWSDTRKSIINGVTNG